MADTGFYVTTFCNRAHRLSDGKPIKHECYELDPARLRAEANADTTADFDKIGPLPREPRRVHGGVRWPQSH